MSKFLEHFKVGHYYWYSNRKEKIYKIIHINVDTKRIDYKNLHNTEEFDDSFGAFLIEREPEVKYMKSPLWKKLEGINEGE